MSKTEHLPPDNLPQSASQNEPFSDLWFQRLSRRTALRLMAGVAAGSVVAPAIAASSGKEPLKFEVSRFMMKGDRPRLEVRAQQYAVIQAAG